MSVSARLRIRLAASLTAIAAAALLLSPAAMAGEQVISPQTRIRLTVTQWMPAKGQYERWEALGGEFTVSADGTITLPVIGTTEVTDRSLPEIAQAIAEGLKNKIGLVAAPEATIEVVEYPPIYVVGDVAKPGEYKYRAGMTALQALALGGGEKRATEREGSQDDIRLLGELKQIDDATLRGEAALVRLKAEMAGDADVAFGDMKVPEGAADRAQEVFAQERIILAARTGALERQGKALTDLRELFGAEISVLSEKIKDADASIAGSQAQLKSVKQLVEQGYATTSRQLDLERALAGYRTDRLDQVTATMRARQGISEATRNLETLRGDRRTEIAQSTQKEQAHLEELRRRREVIQQLLVERVSLGAAQSRSASVVLSYSVVRQADGSEQLATEATELFPGDVLRVRRELAADSFEPASDRSLVPPTRNGFAQK